MTSQATGQQTDVALIDISRLNREGIKRLLEGSSVRIVADYATVAEALEDEDALTACDALVVRLTDNGDSINALDRLTPLQETIKLVVMADSSLEHGYLLRAFEIGADGYMLSDVSVEAFEQTLRLVMLGERIFPGRLASLLLTRGQEAEAMHGDDDLGHKGHLSPRERQILQCLANGEPNKVIANNLDITEATVKVHLRSLLKKIGAQNRTQAAIWAVNRGLADRPEAGPGFGAGPEVPPELRPH